ncbi:hypothetical protein A8M31_01835 [Escherichia coli]|nr:hypothetical protein A8M31_01835 [Escherichia coli]
MTNMISYQGLVRTFPKQPVGEYRSDALAAEEILTLANWCLLNYSGLKTLVGSAS